MSDLEREFARLNERMAESMQRVESLIGTMESERNSASRELEKEEDQRAQAARKGELGPAWQKVQQRIDLKQTTLDEVFSGKDESVEAQQLVKQAKAKTAAIHEQFARVLEDDPEAENPLGELQLLQKRLSDRLSGMGYTEGARNDG